MREAEQDPVLAARTKALERCTVQLDRAQATLRSIVSSSTPYVITVEDEDEIDGAANTLCYLVPAMAMKMAKDTLAPWNPTR